MASRTAGIVTVLFVLSFALLATGTQGSPPVTASKAQAMAATGHEKMADMKAHVQVREQARRRGATCYRWSSACDSCLLDVACLLTC